MGIKEQAKRETGTSILFKYGIYETEQNTKLTMSKKSK